MGSARIYDSEKLSVKITVAALEAIFTRLSHQAHRAAANRRPWTELADWSAFARPDSLAEAASRIRKNLFYFRMNYLFVLAFVLAVSVLSHPLSLFLLLAVVGAWLFLYVLRPSDQQLVVLGRSFTDCEALVGLSFVTVMVILVSNVLSVILTGLTMWVGMVCGHGAFRVPEDVLFEDQGQQSWFSGVFSFEGKTEARPSIRVPVGPVLV